MTHHKEKIDAETLIGWASLDLMRVADQVRSPLPDIDLLHRCCCCRDAGLRLV